MQEPDDLPRAPRPSWQYSRSDRSKRNHPLLRRYRDLRRRATAPIVPAVAPLALRGLARTWRVEFENRERREEVLESPEGCIAVLWHGRMATAAPVFAGINTIILVSMSGDGELADTLLRRLGYRTLRGSTRKFGVSTMRTMREMLRGGGAVAITPDGPRGPLHRVNRGAAFLARATGLPILPIGFGVSRAAHLRSWDRFTIPHPGSRVAVVMAEPLRVPSHASDDDLGGVSGAIRDSLIAAETRAFERLGAEVDW